MTKKEDSDSKKVNTCHCGKPLHYTNKETERIMKMFVAELGEFIPLTVGKRTWEVQRHYIALHGVKARELPDLGFKEITNG